MKYRHARHSVHAAPDGNPGQPDNSRTSPRHQRYMRLFGFVHSIRFRIWILFIGFTSSIMLFLYLNQIVMLPYYYDFIKTQESLQTVNYIKTVWNNENLIDVVENIAQENEMRIQIWYLHPYVVSYTKDPNRSYQKVTFNESIDANLASRILESPTGIYRTQGKESNTNRNVLFVATYVGNKSDPDGYILVSNYIQPLANTSDVLKRQFYINATIVLFIAFILSAFVVVQISNPIIKISRSAKKLASGEFNMRTRKFEFAEIKLLTESLNRASVEIAKTENLRKDLIANVSHDLKTPLTMIKAYAEMIRDISGNHPEKRDKHVQVIIDEADRLNGLVMDMLDLSKLQSGVAKLTLEKFDLSAHLLDILTRFGYLTEENTYTIEKSIEPKLIIKADISKLEQVIYNLVNNAVNHTGDDGYVLIRLYKKKANILRFEVKDHGNGIPKEELALIWERYYKAEKSEFHKRTTVGTGLGLSIVKGVLESHGFSYGVDSILKKGSTFWFEAPCETAEAVGPSLGEPFPQAEK